MICLREDVGLREDLDLGEDLASGEDLDLRDLALGQDLDSGSIRPPRPLKRGAYDRSNFDMRIMRNVWLAGWPGFVLDL